MKKKILLRKYIHIFNRVKRKTVVSLRLEYLRNKNKTNVKLTRKET